MKGVLDVCCGPKSMWFDKRHPAAVYADMRAFGPEVIWRGTEHGRQSERSIEVRPDVRCNWAALPFPDATFSLVAWDPPHIRRSRSPTEKCWLARRYGSIGDDWREQLRAGFSECMRVLKPAGTLVFKWCEADITTSKVIEALGSEPLFGHKSGKASKTHWLCFIKESAK